MSGSRLSARLFLALRFFFALGLCALAAVAGCALPSEEEHEACELEPQVISSLPQGLEQDDDEDVASVQEELSSLSCKMSGTTGYKSGNAFDIKVVTIDGKKVEWKTANAYMQMAEAAQKDGVQIRIVSGFRSMSEQQYLYSCYKNCSCNSCNLAAPPGYSNHQSGHALDLNTSAGGVYGWLSKHAGKFGFKRTVPSEAWHWEWWGDDDGTGPCNSPTLKAKLTKRWSNAKRHRGKKANYTVCAGKDFRFSLTFKNKGTAVWHDVDGRGKKVGSDVFLVTANGKTDKLTGRKRFSVDLNKNAHVHGGRKAKDCSTKNGCKRTTFIKGAIEATAPKKPGIYTTRWRLRDYSKAWGKKSKGFGPKAQLEFQVVSCEQPNKECGCRVWCTDGKSHKLAASISSAAMCKSVADTYCKPAGYLDHSFQACQSQSGGSGGSGGNAGGSGGTAGGSGGGEEDQTPPAPSVEPPSSPPGDETPEASPAEEGPEPVSSDSDEGDEDEPNGIESTDDESEDGVGSEEADDPDFEDDGYPGHDGATIPATEAGCSVSGSGSGSPLGLGVLGVLGVAWLVRRRRARRSGRTLAAFAGMLAVLALVLAGCGADSSVPEKRAELGGDSPLVQTFVDAESETGVPAEMLATLSWLQARLSMNLGAADTDSHGLPREQGLMAIGSGGLRSLEDVAKAANLDPNEVATDPRSNVRAAARWLAAEASRQGLIPTRDADWAPVLEAWAGKEVSTATLRLLSTGWEGSDDDGHGISVSGSEAEHEADAEHDGLGTTQQELGYPGGKWSPAASSNYSQANRGKAQINYIVIHTIQGSYAGAISWFKNPAAKVSSHYVVRSHDGAVTQMVDDRDIAWHDGCFNTNSIGIEHEGFVTQPKKWYTEEMYRGSARLSAWLADKYGIPKDRKHILGHAETPDCSDHTDPGSGWNWGLYMKLVKNGGKIETLKAKSVRKWSNARRFRGKKADYVACAGDDVKLSFTFKNVGSAKWHDIEGRGKKVGSDVFLVTANGKKDPLTGHKRFSLRNNLNRHVHGDRKAKNCSNENGCRKTTFVAGGMKAKAPNKPGIYHSRWRLRDYSKAWGKKSHGFGPKVDLSLKVVKCDQPKAECGCRVWCSDGKSHKLAASIDSAAECKSVAETFCKPDKLLSHSFQACDSTEPGTGGGADDGSGGEGGQGGASAGAGGSDSDPTAAAPGAGGGDEGSSEDTPAADPEEGSEDGDNGYDVEDTEDDPDVLPVEDDPDFDDDGFDGNEEPAELAQSEAGCSVSPAPRGPETPLFAFTLLGIGIAIGLRRRARALAAVALSSLSAAACTEEVGGGSGEELGESLQALSAPKKAFCTIPVDGKGKKAMETDYIPHVITCENGGADFQALKAQAIAARSVAYYSMLTKGSICDSQGCQVYSCGAGASERAKKAAKETAGMYLSHDGTLTYAFYVAGDSGASGPGCKDHGGSTSHYVTYNWGKKGSQVEQTSLGYIGPPGFDQNRGCMSQWGARCLEKSRDFNYLEILRFYYGQDIKITQAEGDCVPDTKTLRAKLTKKWTNAKRYRGKHAQYVVCAEQPFEMTFSFKNTGSATWHDVKHRGKNMGSDVFLVTANGKTDELTGRKRFSLRNNENSEVRGDHKAKNCVTKDGCRKTRFIKGGIEAVAPKKPGIYSSRWRLRDYSKHWGKKSHGFGPKVEMRVKVVACEQKSSECGCRAFCTNGKSHKLAASIDSAAECKSVAQTFCGGGKYLDHEFNACSPDPTPQPGDTDGDADQVEPPAGSGGSAGAAGSAGADSGSAGAGGASGGGEEAGATPDGEEDEEVDNGLTPEEGADGEEDVVEEEDDADFEEDGFDGDEEGGTIPANESCAVTNVGTGSAGMLGALGVLLGIGLFARRRRVGKA